MYRPLPGTGGGSGPAYDDTGLTARVDEHDTRLLVLESDDGKTYSLAPIRDGEGAQLRISLPFDIGADPFGTFGLAGYTADSAFIATVGGTDVVIPMTPDTVFAEFANDLDVALRSGDEGVAEIAGGPGAWVLRILGVSAITIRANAASAFFGWAEESEPVVPGIPAFWQGGETLRVPEDYPTLEAALAMAGSRFALPGAFVDVSVADGRHERTTTINLDDARLGHVRVRGRSAPDVWTGAASYTVSGSAKSWSVTVPVSTAFAALCAVDDFLLVEVTSNYGSEVNRNCVQGYFRVVGKTSNSVTLFVTAYPTLSGATANLKMTRFRSVFWCVDVEFATAADAVLPMFENVGIVRSTRTTTWTAINLVRSKMANSGDLAIGDFGYSFWLSGPGCEFRGQLVVGTGSPVIYNDAYMALKRCIIGGCNGDSVSIGSGGRFVVDSDGRHSFIGGSNNVGVYAGNRGSFLIRGDDIRIVGQYSTSIVANDRSNGHLGPSVAYGSISPAIGVTGNNNSSITQG